MEYGHHVNFKNMVAPLAVVKDGARFGGSGFLVQISGQTYLVTVAHLPTGGQLQQTDEWALWADEITLHDSSDRLLGRTVIFDTNQDGSKTPLFKYCRSNDTAGLLADIILLPLPAGDPMTGMSEVFHLPAPATFNLKEAVTAVGCRPWPSITTAGHVITAFDGAVLHLDPPTQPGYSGGPIVNSSGNLLAMSFGMDNPSTPGTHGLTLTVGLILAMAGAVDGFIAGQPYSYRSPKPPSGM